MDTVTGANETLTNSLADAQKNLAKDRWDAWLKGSKALVGLDAQSATQTAQSLANAIGQLATDSPASGFNPNNGTGWSGPNPFWTALAEKAQQSADYIATTKRAQRFYYGSSPWSETIVNGDGSVIIVDNMMGASGILDDRRDFEVGTAEAQAVLRKGAQAAAGRRDREIADANLTLAQARSSYEVGWAQMGAEDSQWKLERSDLPIQGSDNGSITTTTTAGTQFVPGVFRMTPPAADQQANSPRTSTGFGGNDLDQYFSNGFLKNGVDDQTPPAQLAGPAGEPIAQEPPNLNQVQDPETLPPDDSKVTYDPAETQSAFGALVGWVTSWFDGEEEPAVNGTTPPSKPSSPMPVPSGSLDLSPPRISDEEKIRGALNGTPDPFDRGGDRLSRWLNEPQPAFVEQEIVSHDTRTGRITKETIVVLNPALEAEIERAIAIQLLMQETTSAIGTALKSFADSVRDKLTDEAEDEWVEFLKSQIELFQKKDPELFKRIVSETGSSSLIGDMLELNAYIEYQIAFAEKYGRTEDGAGWRSLWRRLNGTPWDDKGAVAESARGHVESVQWSTRFALLWGQRKPALLDEALKGLETPPDPFVASGNFTAITRGFVNLFQVMRYGANGERSPFRTKDSFVRGRLQDEIIMNPFFNLEESRLQAEMDWERGVDITTLPGRNEAVLVLLLPLEFAGAAAESRTFLNLQKYSLDSVVDWRTISAFNGRGPFGWGTLEIPITGMDATTTFLRGMKQEEALLLMKTGILQSHAMQNGSTVNRGFWRWFMHTVQSQKSRLVTPSPFVSITQNPAWARYFGRRGVVVMFEVPNGAIHGSLNLIENERLVLGGTRVYSVRYMPAGYRAPAWIIVRSGGEIIGGTTLISGGVYALMREIGLYEYLFGNSQK